MSNSLEYLCEQVFIELLKADRRLCGKEFFHFDEDNKAKTECIVAEAVEGNKRLDGDRASDMRIEIDYRSTAVSKKALNDVVASAIQEAVYNATSARSPALSKFATFIILSESDGARENEHNLRTRTRTFPVIARLK